MRLTNIPIVLLVTLSLTLAACEEEIAPAASPATQQPPAGGGDETPTPGDPTIGEPTQSECIDTALLPLTAGEDGSSVSMVVEGGTLTVADSNAEFNCCLEAWMEVAIDGQAIDVTEVEDPDKGMACLCMCPFELSIAIADLAAGEYTVRVWREGYDGDELLEEQTIVIE